DALTLPANEDFSLLIVDWVWIELIDANDTTNTVFSRSALLKRNGEIVELDGDQPIICDVPDGDYYLKLDHRNHLEVYTASPITISCGKITVDLKNNTTPVLGGSEVIKDLGFGDFGLYAGDVNGDGRIQYAGATPEGPEMLSFVLNDPSNLLGLPTFPIEGYSNYDINMDGVTQYTGTNSEMPLILENILSNLGNLLNDITWSIDAESP
ncbi:MAG: hemagglutinin protein, partial [Psychroserpens sp.]|nr:hemagglutinin protein [Psychroserpens sp.]